jgi:hypothetical protein
MLFAMFDVIGFRGGVGGEDGQVGVARLQLITDCP